MLIMIACFNDSSQRNGVCSPEKSLWRYTFKIMKEIKQTRKQLEKRRDEINEQLNRVNRDERVKLDNDMEEQAIQLEQHDVAITMEANLRKELIEIEDKLAEMDEKEK